MTRYTIAFTFSLICALLMPFAARAVTVPAGTSLWVRTLDQVSSSDKAGKNFAARLDVNLVVKGRVVIPAGSKVYGCIESFSSTGQAFGQSKLALSLRKVVVNGRPVAITTGTYEESDPRSGRKTDGKAPAGAVIPAVFGGAAIGAAGAAIGGAFGTPAAGAAMGAAGAVIGPAVGAAIGATTRLIGRGKSIDAPVGALFEFRLTQPVYL
jgi:hypothetical protein